MNIKEKFKPRKLNVILFIIGFILAYVLLAFQVNCFEPCDMTPAIVFSIIIGIIFYILASLMK